MHNILFSNLFSYFAEKEDFLTLYLLCYLVKPKRGGKRKRTERDAPPRKLSLQERRESFILRAEVIFLYKSNKFFLYKD